MKLATVFMTFLILLGLLSECSTALRHSASTTQNVPTQAQTTADVPPGIVGTWSNQRSSLTITYTFNADGSYQYEIIASTANVECSSPPEVAKSQGTFTISGDKIHYDQISGITTCLNKQTQSNNILSVEQMFVFSVSEPDTLNIDGIIYIKQR